MVVLPIEIVNEILKYDGRIYKRNGEYIDKIHKYDHRYKIIENVINRKKNILKTVQTNSEGGFYFEFNFMDEYDLGLCYDCNFSNPDEFEICYYDVKDGWKQTRTYI